VINEAPVESSPEQAAADDEDDDMEIKEQVSKQTIGANLAHDQDDQKSMAATEKQNV